MRAKSNLRQRLQGEEPSSPRHDLLALDVGADLERLLHAARFDRRQDV